MSRGQGSVYQRGSVWWLDYTVGGMRNREPAAAATSRDAKAELRKKITDREAGRVVGRPDRVTLSQLKDLVVRQYALDGRKSGGRVKEAYAHLEAFFGPEARASTLTRARLDAYAEHRLTAGRARATVNQELAQLRRGFRLAIETGLLAVMPVFKLPKPKNARTGFFEEGEFAAVMLELPADARRDLVEFLHGLGWRRDEGRLLQWVAVDRVGCTIRLEQARSKSGRSRVFPYGRSRGLTALVERRWAERNGVYVFHRGGQPIGKEALRYAWKLACLRAGLATKDPETKKIIPHRMVHDFRRTAARDLRRAGVDEGSIMALCGWETRSMFDRYNIINESDLAHAVAKRYVTPASQSVPTTESSLSVS